MPKTIKLKQIKQATMADPVLSKVAEFVSSEDWREARGRLEFMPYIKIIDELSVNSEQNVVLRGTKIVLSLADDVLKILHEGHLVILESFFQRDC